mgnify:CR=1 FL=1
MCNRVIETIQCICPTCITNLPRTEEALLRENLTEEPFLHIRNFGVGASFLFFEKDAPVQTLLHRMKYGRFAEPHIGYELAQLAAKEFMEYGFFDDIDVIVPVPLHRKRLKERGFNQAEWIAKGLSDSTHIPMDTTHLLRIRNNAHQAQEQGRDRKKNVEHLFDVNHPEEWYRLHILLVDDIITTGSTLLSCIDALSPVRDAQFSVFAIGKSRTNNSHINVEQ